MWLVYDIDVIPNEPRLNVKLEWDQDGVAVNPILTETYKIDLLDRRTTVEQIRDYVHRRSEELDRALVKFGEIQTSFGFARSTRTKIT